MTKQESKLRVLFIDSTHPILLEMLEQAGFECQYSPELNKAECLDVFHLFDGIIIRSKFLLSKEELQKASKLKFIGRVGAGLENIDLDYASSQNIVCFNAPEGNRDAVGEHALGMLLSLFNNLYRCNSEISEGKWRREANRGLEVKGKTIGIIGYGNMGQAFAKCISGLDCTVIAYDKYAPKYGDKYASAVSLEYLFEHADVLSLHIPQTQESVYMVDDSFINKFKKKIFIVNTARGKHIKIADLVSNIKSGKIRGACLDVLEYEKSSFENLHANNLPADFKYLINSDSVLMSPHVAGWTVESNVKLSQVLAQKIIDKFA